MESDESVERRTTSRRKRVAWPEDPSFGILVAIVLAGVLWAILFVVFRVLI